jgi:hypothetical protein
MRKKLREGGKMPSENSKRRRGGEHEALLEQLKDERGKRVVFVSHCLLNENVRYLGGAFRRGGVEEVIMAFIQQGIGIYQMPCPEQRAWGGVLKRYILPWYGSKGTLRYAIATRMLGVFLWYTWQVYRRLAMRVVHDIADYVLSGFEVVGIVGIGGSPSCGVRRTLDIKRSLVVAASCPVQKLNREAFNEAAVAACVIDGEGMFEHALRRGLEQRGLLVPFIEHDILAEMRGNLSSVCPA